MDERGCSAFQIAGQPPKKRKRVDSEFGTSRMLRKRICREAWTKQQRSIDEIIRKANRRTLNCIDRFISGNSPSESEHKIPAGFLQTGPGSTSNDVLFTQIQEIADEKEGVCFALLNSSQCHNLKTVLKSLIQIIIRTDQDDDDEITCDGEAGGPKGLNYDLQMLYNWFEARDIERCVITFPDSEAMSTLVLTDFLTLLSSWQDRLHFILIFGVASSVDRFRSRVPYRSLKSIRGRVFPVPKMESIFDKIFANAVSGTEVLLRMGPSVCEMLLQRQSEHFCSIETFTQSLEYAYMNHFNGNVLSIFASPQVSYETVSQQHFEAFRSLPSFQKYVERLLQDHNHPVAKRLLESDEALFKEITSQLQTSNEVVIWSLGAANVVNELKHGFGQHGILPNPELYHKAMSGTLRSSTYVRELMLQVKTASLEAMVRVVPRVLDILMAMPASDIDVSPDDFRDIQDQLNELHGNVKSNINVLNGEQIPKRQSPRVRLGTPKSKKGQQTQSPRQNDATFRLASRLHGLLSSYFDEAMRGYQEFFGHEILFYDVKAPHRDAFMPRPRYAIERALSCPQDYLGCNCCSKASDGVSETQPATAILYQLFLESGALLNVSDLWSAFQAIIKNRYESEQMTMALFFRSLVEMKSMGSIKPSRKKIDHLAKVSWKGL